MLTLLAAVPLEAQRAATVPASSDVYDRLESVAARFPARGVFLGHRPLSRRALAATLAHLRSAVNAANESPTRRWARAQLDVVSAALGDSADTAAFMARGTWRATQTYSTAIAERIPNNGLGQIDAITQPFGAVRQGEPVGKGTVAELVPVGVVGVGTRFAVGIEPHIGLYSLRGIDGGATTAGSRWYARTVASNVAIEIGADDRRWGQSPIGAQFISGSAAPLPALALSADTAFTLPWLFRYAGPLRATILVADLGGDQTPAHDRLAGWQVSMQPWSHMELGIDALAQTGGAGGPKGTFGQRVVDLLILPDALSPSHSDLQISNKLAGGNVRLRFPSLSGLEMYYELQLDDFDARRLRSMFTDDGSHLLGVRLPVQLAQGELVWRTEWHRTSLRVDEHGQFLSGVTYRERIIGDPLGPNAAAAYLSATWRRTAVQGFTLTLADERRNPSQYVTASNDSLDNGFRFVRLTHDPDYRRLRLTGSATRPFGPGMIALSAGFNHAWRAGQTATARNEWMAALSVSALVPRLF